MRWVNGMMLCFSLMLLMLGAYGADGAAPGDAGGALDHKDAVASDDAANAGRFHVVIINGGKASALEGDDAMNAVPPGGPGATCPFPGADYMGVNPLMPSAVDADNASAGVIIQVHSWRGFALRDNTSYAVRMSIESIRPVEPTSVRKLLASNKSLDEIRNEIRAEEGAVTNQGALKIGGEVFYRLMNLAMAPSGNYTLLEADLCAPKHGAYKNATAILGHLSAKLNSKEDGEASEGTLTINSGKYSGRYKLLLDDQGPEMWQPPGP